MDVLDHRLAMGAGGVADGSRFLAGGELSTRVGGWKQAAVSGAACPDRSFRRTGAETCQARGRRLLCVPHTDPVWDWLPVLGSRGTVGRSEV